MRILLAIAALLLGSLVAGCGKAETTTAPAATHTSRSHHVLSDPDDPHFAVISGGSGRNAEPVIRPPDLPPPQEFLARDLKVGTGPVAERGDEVGVFYFGVRYKTGKEIYYRWPPLSAPLFFRLEPGQNRFVWERGVEGMRVGGRREVIVPARMAYGSGATDYVLELARVAPHPGKSARG